MTDIDGVIEAIGAAEAEARARHWLRLVFAWARNYRGVIA